MAASACELRVMSLGKLDAAREARTPCMQPLTEPHAEQPDSFQTARAGMPQIRSGNVTSTATQLMK